MFNNSDLSLEKYFGWLERIIEIIMKLFGFGGSVLPTEDASAE